MKKRKEVKYPLRPKYKPSVAWINETKVPSRRDKHRAIAKYNTEAAKKRVHIEMSTPK